MLIYHRVPDDLVGTTLQPLNRLRETMPEKYTEYVRKYEGREVVLQQRVLNLDCLWNDVLQFSPVHPALIAEALQEAGFPCKPEPWFEVDPQEHGFDRTNTSLFLHHPRERGDFEQRLEDFADFSLSLLKSYSELPTATKEYFRECKSARVRPFMFLWVPHVMFRGELDIAALKRIEA